MIGVAQAAPAHLAKEHVRLAVAALGANALAAARVPAQAPALAPAATQAPNKPRRATETPLDQARTLDSLPPRRASQSTLFGAELQPKIIPFETLPRTTSNSGAAVAPALEVPRVKRPAKPRAPTLSDSQTTLDFLPPLKNTPRTNKTGADTVIFCQAEVAAPLHRATAAGLDLAMILIGFGILLAIFQTWAQPVALNRTSVLMLGCMLPLCALLYGLLFAVAGTVTPGLRWTDLRLINFDGFPPDGRSRALRLMGCWISACSGGLGLLWALLDEENLTWHDHMSKTFPTLRESESILVRHRNH